MKLQLVVRRAQAMAGVRWLQQAWAIFKKYPGLCIQTVMLIHFTSLLGALHPLLGVIAALLNPFLTAGLYRCVVAMQQQQQVSMQDFWIPLKDSSVRAVFLRLAAANMLLSIPLTLLATQLATDIAAGVNNLGLMFVFVMLLSLVMMMFAYAVAIAYFLKEKRLFPILQASLLACWRNVQPLTIYGVLAIGLLMTGIPTLFFTWLLVLPLLSISFFLSFSEFFALTPASDNKVEYLEV